MSDIFRRESNAGIDPTSGLIGWQPVGVRFFEPRDYRHRFGAVHDAMEHPERIDATLKNELQAQGAALYIRPSASMPSLIGANIAWFYKQVHAGNFPDAPTHETGFRAMWELNVGSDTRGAFSHVVSQVRKHEPSFSILEASTVTYWLAYGYDVARARYRGIERTRLAGMFENADNAVRAIGTDARIGDRLVVTIDYAHATTAVEKFI